MNDLEKTKQFFDSLGVGYDENEDEDEIQIILAADEHNKVVGYYYFYCEFLFNQKGEFLKIGIWE